jgi:nitrogen fixation protein
VNSITVNNTTQITANITISANTPLGARDVSVTNAAPGGGTATLTNGFTVASNPAPTLTNISSTSGNRLQTLDVVFTGTNFISGVTTVNVGSDITVNSTTVNSSTSLTANLIITAAAATGARNFSVTNSAPGGGTSANQTFTVNNPLPTLASLSPTNGNRLQTLDVVFTGTNFIDGVSSVNFGADITVNSETVNLASGGTQITANITIDAAAAFGQRNVSVTNSGPGGGTSANQIFIIGNNPAPTLTSIAPNIGNRLQTLDIVFTGTNFINGITSVNVDSGGSGITVNSTTVNSSTSLTVNLTITAAAATGTRFFFVTNNGPGGGSSASQSFTVNNPAPTLTSIAPTNGNRLQTLVMLFDGANFIEGVSTINFGADITVDSTTVDPANGGTTQIAAKISIGANAALGPRNVSITNNGPGGGTSGNQTFTVTDLPAAPSNVTAIAVSNSQINLTWQDNATNESGFTIELSTDDDEYNEIATVPANTTSYSSTGLEGSTEYFYRVRAFNADGNSAYSEVADDRTFPNAPSNLVATVVSNSQINLTWNNNSIDDSGFIIERKIGVSGAYSKIDTVEANVTSYSNIGLAASTNYYYRVLAYNDEFGDNSAYSNESNATTFSSAPTLTSISPTSGNRLQTLDVVFTGTNFIDGVTSVRVDSLISGGLDSSIIVNSTIVNSSTSLTANLTITAAAATGARYFYVTNSGPGGGTSTNQTFTVNNPAPTLTSLAPSNGDRLQTLDVVLTGTNFISGVSSVSFGTTIPVNSTTVNSATQITANITISANTPLGSRDVSVTNAAPGGGTATLTNGFTVANNPAPTLTSISPTSGSRLQTLEVIFTGTNFISGVSSVDFGNDISINSTIVNSAKQITTNFTIGSNAAVGARNVSVTNATPGGGTATLTNGFTVGSNPAPTLTSISPTSGNRLQTLDVVFTGTNFIDGVSSAGLQFMGGIEFVFNSVVVNSATQITANITILPFAPLGPRDVFVTNAAPGGGTATLTNGFTVNNPVPTLTSISPPSGGRLQTLEVVLSGTSFISGVTSVSFGADITVDSTTVNTATQITASITIGASATLGPRNVSITNATPGGGTTVLTNGFTVGNNPAPTLASISPINGNHLQTLEVVFTGTNFIDGVTSVNVGDGITVNSTTVNSTTSLTANLTITVGAAPGARSFSVSNSGPGGGTSVNRTFTVRNPAPTLTSITPTTGNRLQTLEVIFTGTNFISGISSVSFGAGITVNSITVDSTTQITANITIISNAALTARNVSVTNTPPGGGTATLTNGFTVAGNPSPTLASISLTSGNRLQTLEVVFTGTNFISGITAVNIGTGITINSMTVNSSTSLTANLTITAAAATGGRNFSVVNSGPGGGTSAIQTFTVENPGPTLISVSPVNGDRLQTLDVVFTGTNFISGVTAVSAGAGMTINSITVNSSANLTANLTITAAAAIGARNFSITNNGPGGGTSGNQTFTINNPSPTLTSVSPPTGSRLQTLEVVLAGTNFINGVSTMDLGADITVNSTTVNSAIQMTANITIGSEATLGARDISVSNAPPGGGTATLTNGFMVGSNPAPTLTSISPPAGNRLQTLEVIFTGTNFINNASSVDLGADITINSTVVNNATQLTANITIGANAAFGAREVSVINAPPGGGTATLTNGFMVGSNPAPTLTGILPITGNRLQTLDVVFTGTNFISGVTDLNTGNGITVNSIAVNNSTSLTANLTITAGAATGPRNFSATNTGPGGGISANRTFTVNNPSPTVTTLSPPNGRRLQTLAVVFTGANFISEVTTLDFGAGITVNSTTVNSPTQITANITIDSNATLGARDVSITNAPPGGGTVILPSGFTVGSNPTPTLASIAPTSGRRLQTLEVVFTGTNFINEVTTVSAGPGITVNSTTVNSSTSLTVNLTITAAAATGARSFAVINSGPGGGTSTNRTFTVNNPTPTLTSLSPTNGNRLQTLEVVFVGTNFISGVSSVNFGAGITVNSTTVNPANGGTQITANITISSNAALGARNASVTNTPPGGGTAILTNGFVIGNNPVPTLTGLSPSNGDRFQTLEVMLTGTNFISGVSSVNFGAGITLNSTTVNSSTQITANITIGSNAALGGRDVSITNAPPGGGMATLANSFTVGNNTAPTLTGISPIIGNRLQTLDVIFTGMNFISGSMAVNVGSGITINSTAVNSPTSLTANLTITASAATGARNFSVTNTGAGGGTSASQAFTVNNPSPILTSISPSTGSRLQTLEVTFTGTNFISEATTVDLGAGITVNSITVNSPTSLTANLTITNAATTGARSFAVINSGPGGGTSGSQTFTIGNLAPLPLSPSNLIAEALSMGEINLRWTDNSNNETGFKIVRRVEAIGPEVTLFTGPNVQNYKDTGLTRGTSATYQVIAFNDGGDSPPSNFAGERTATGVRCDVTRDFIVDANDVDFEIRVILQNPLKKVTHLDSTVADTNLDGKINIIDMVDMVNESLKYLLAAPTPPRENNNAGAGSELCMGAAEIIVGTSIKLPLTISAAEPVTALQLKIRGDSRGLAMGDVFLSTENRGMTLATARGADQLAVLIYSLSGDCIAPGTRELLQFSLQAESADFLKTGLQIENALLIGKSGTSIPVRITNDAMNLKINLPDKFVLSQNYPNPFDTGAANPRTEIVYNLPAAVAVKLAVYNVLGHEVALLVNSWQTPGVKKVAWNGRDQEGKRVTAGVYFYRLEAGEFVAREKMVLR